LSTPEPKEPALNQSATLTPTAPTGPAPVPLTAHDRCDAGTRRTPSSPAASCNAQAWVRATLPTAGSLLFCGHHYHAHATTLAAHGASIDDFTGQIPGTPGTSA
jgi:hypothetical protein